MRTKTVAAALLLGFVVLPPLFYLRTRDSLRQFVGLRPGAVVPMLRHRSTENALVILMAPLLLISTFQTLQPGPSMILSTLDMARLFGAGFCSDPCTWDGFATGMMGALCLMGNVGSCGGAVLAAMKAVKFDNYF